MSAPSEPKDRPEPSVAELDKEVRTLRRKLDRAEQTRARSEAIREQNDLLLRNVINELSATQGALERSKVELEERVEERTEALLVANERLRVELIERDRLNSEVAAARDAAIDANRAKSAFLATMSHELRTPLNVIIGYAELIREVAIEEGAAFLTLDIDHVRGAATHLLSLIDDILDLAKIESGTVRTSLETLDVDSLIAELVATMRPLVGDGRNELRVAVAADVGRIESDRLKLRQILLNLLSNATKFTLGGEIRVEVGRDPDAVYFAIHDSGIGIPPEKVAVIFEPFTQVDSSATRLHGGTGLGLAISRRFAQALGGTLDVVSVEGLGSTFTLRLPASPLAECAGQSRAATPP